MNKDKEGLKEDRKYTVRLLLKAISGGIVLMAFYILTAWFWMSIISWKLVAIILLLTTCMICTYYFMRFFIKIQKYE